MLRVRDILQERAAQKRAAASRQRRPLAVCAIETLEIFTVSPGRVSKCQTTATKATSAKWAAVYQAQAAPLYGPIAPIDSLGAMLWLAGCRSMSTCPRCKGHLTDSLGARAALCAWRSRCLWPQSLAASPRC